jgi:HSP20 family protein
MRLGAEQDGVNDVDDLFRRWFGEGMSPVWSGGHDIPTEIFHMDDKLVIRMDLPGVDPDDVDVTVQDNSLVVNGKRHFPYSGEGIRWMRRSIFYGDFTRRLALGKGLDLDKIGARFDAGVLELTVPYTEDVAPRKIAIQKSETAKALN